MLQPGRHFNAPDYRFGFNGQEKTDEISGNGNHNRARYWEYDTRLGRRWNQDPKPHAGISNYACFSNNPVFLTDPLGDTTHYFDKRGRYLGMTEDQLENQIHFFENKAQYDNLQKNISNAIANGIDPVIANKVLVASARKTSMGYLGKNSMEALKNIYEVSIIEPNEYEGKGRERGGVLKYSRNGEFVPYDLSDKAYRMSDEIKMDQVTSDEGFVFGVFHTHVKGIKPGDPSISSWWADYEGSVRNMDGTCGGEAALIVTENYITIYGTIRMDWNKEKMDYKNYDPNKNIGIEKKYTTIKTNFFGK